MRTAAVRGAAVVGIPIPGRSCAADRFPDTWMCGTDPDQSLDLLPCPAAHRRLLLQVMKWCCRPRADAQWSVERVRCRAPAEGRACYDRASIAALDADADSTKLCALGFRCQTPRKGNMKSRIKIAGTILVTLALLGAGVARGQTPNSPLSPTTTTPTQVRWVDATPGQWQWLEDYAFFAATYVIGCPRDRRCRVGSGMFVAGSPHGSQKEFSGDIAHTVLGFGAQHVRVEDGTAPARIGFYRKEQMLIPIYPPPGSVSPKN